MRITNGMMAATTLRNLNRTMEKLDRLQDELTSGQRISAASDDPIGAAAAVEFRGALSELEQHVRNVDAANSWLEATDLALDSITKVLHRTRELVTQGASDTLSQADRSAMTNELTTLIDQAVAQANSTYAGQYLFSGFKVSTVPFSFVDGSSPSVEYYGDAGAIKRQVDNRSLVTVNIPGSTALSDVFSMLITVREAMTSGTPRTISAKLADLDNALDSTLAIRAEVGARVNRLSGQADRLEGLRINLSGLLSKTQDADMVEAISDFATQQNVYEAALAAGAKSIQRSLLDYLR